MTKRNVSGVLRVRYLATAIAATAVTASAAVVLPANAADARTAVVAAAADSTPRGYLSDHVIVISVDGLRPDAIEKFGAKTLQRLMREGSYSLEASTIPLSKTLPSHTSMLTGTLPEEHGVTWNSKRMDDHGHVATATIFAAAKAAGFHTAAFFSKSKFQHLAVPGTLDYSQAPGGLLGKWSADRTVDDAERYIAEHKPNLLFVHVGEPDFAGHLTGWMSTPYAWAVREADDEIAELLQTAEHVYGAGNFTVLVTADHGGHGRGHGSADPLDVTIPWIAWGKGVTAATVLKPGIRTMDTAATALWLLGVAPAGSIVGAPVEAAFTLPRTVIES